MHCLLVEKSPFLRNYPTAVFHSKYRGHKKIQHTGPFLHDFSSAVCLRNNTICHRLATFMGTQPQYILVVVPAVAKSLRKWFPMTQRDESSWYHQESLVLGLMPSFVRTYWIFFRAICFCFHSLFQVLSLQHSEKKFPLGICVIKGKGALKPLFFCCKFGKTFYRSTSLMNLPLSG